jgi:hypothetical protein
MWKSGAGHQVDLQVDSVDDDWETGEDVVSVGVYVNPADSALGYGLSCFGLLGTPIREGTTMGPRERG